MKPRSEFRGLKSDMKAVVQSLILIFIGHYAIALVDFPKECLSSGEGLCHFGTMKKISTYEAGDMQIFLGKETLLKKDKGNIEWVYGPVLFEVESKSEVYFKKFPITLQKGKYLFFGEERKLQVEVLDGNFSVEKYMVTEGFRAVFALENDSLTLEPLQAIDLKEHLVRYVNVKNLNKSQAEDYIAEFVPKHKNYVAWVDELNDNLWKRSIAQEQHVLKQARAAKERAQLAQQKRKQAYFDKVFDR